MNPSNSLRMVTSVFEESACDPGHRAPTAKCVSHFHAPSKPFMKAPNSLDGTCGGGVDSFGAASAFAGTGNLPGIVESSKGSPATEALGAPAGFATDEEGATTGTNTHTMKATTRPHGRTAPLVIMVTPRYLAVETTSGDHSERIASDRTGTSVFRQGLRGYRAMRSNHGRRYCAATMFAWMASSVASGGLPLVIAPSKKVPLALLLPSPPVPRMMAPCFFMGL